MPNINALDKCDHSVLVNHFFDNEAYKTVKYVADNLQLLLNSQYSQANIKDMIDSAIASALGGYITSGQLADAFSGLDIVTTATVDEKVKAVSDANGSLAEIVTQLSTDFGTLDTYTNGTVKQTLKTLSDASGSQASAITELDAAYKDADSDVTAAIQEKLDVHTSDLESVASDLLDMATEYRGLNTSALGKITSLTQVVSDGDKANARAITALDTKFTGLETNTLAEIDRLDEAVSSATEAVATAKVDLRTEFQGLNTATNSRITSFINSTSNALESIGADVTDINTGVISELQEAVGDINDTLSSHTTDIGTLNTDSTTMKGRLDTLAYPGTNMLSNTEFAGGKTQKWFRWEASTGMAYASSSTVNNPDDTWHPANANVLSLYQANILNDQSKHIAWISYSFAIIPNQWYQFYAWVASHRAKVATALVFLKADGSTIATGGNNVSTITSSVGSGGTLPSSFTQLGKVAVKAPADAVYARFEFRKYDTLSVGGNYAGSPNANSWAWAFHPYVGLANELQTTFNEYTVGTDAEVINTVITEYKDAVTTATGPNSTIMTKINTLTTQLGDAATGKTVTARITDEADIRSTDDGNIITSVSSLSSFVSYAPNLVKNPSAVLGLEGWTSNLYTTGKLVPTQGSWGEGYFFLSENNFTQANVPQYYQDIPVSALTVHSIQAAMYTGNAPTNCWAQVHCQFLNSSGNHISDGGVLRLLGGNAWTTLKVEGFTIPTGCTTVRLWISIGGTGNFTGTNIAIKKIKLERSDTCTLYTDDATQNVVSSYITSFSNSISDNAKAINDAVTEYTTSFKQISNGGGNLLGNTDWINDSYLGWEVGCTTSAYTSSYGVGLSGAEWYPGVKPFTIWQQNTSGSGGSNNYNWIYQTVPAEGNKYYQVYAYMACHRAKVAVTVFWLDSAGNYIDISYSGPLTVGEGGTQWSGFSQVGFYSLKAPPGTVKAKIEYRKFDTLATSTDKTSWLWILKPYFGAARDLQTGWNEYSVGSGTRLIAESLSQISTEAYNRSQSEEALGSKIDKVKASVFISPNLLVNSTFSKGTEGWVVATGASAIPYSATSWGPFLALSNKSYSSETVICYTHDDFLPVVEGNVEYTLAYDSYMYGSGYLYADVIWYASDKTTQVGDSGQKVRYAPYGFDNSRDTRETWSNTWISPSSARYARIRFVAYGTVTDVGVRLVKFERLNTATTYTEDSQGGYLAAAISSAQTAISTLDTQTASLTTQLSAGSPNLLKNGSAELGMNYWELRSGAFSAVNTSWGSGFYTEPNAAGTYFFDSNPFFVSGNTKYVGTMDSSCTGTNTWSRIEYLWYSNSDGLNGFLRQDWGPNVYNSTFDNAAANRVNHKLAVTSPPGAVACRVRLVVGSDTMLNVGRIRAVKFEQGESCSAYSSEATIYQQYLTSVTTQNGVTTALAKAGLSLNANGEIVGYEMTTNGVQGGGNIKFTSSTFQIVNSNSGSGGFKYSNNLLEVVAPNGVTVFQAGVW